MSEPAATRPPLVEEVLSGRNRELQLLAAQGILPLPQENLIEVQVHLAQVDDAEVADQAARSLRELDTLSILPFLTREADMSIASYFLRTASDPILLEGLIQRRDFSAELACEVAASLSPEIQEILLLRQDLIVENPEILESLEKNQDLSSYSARRIAEYRRHLIQERPEVLPEIEEVAETEPFDEGMVDLISEEELQAAIEEIKESVEPDGELDVSTGLTEAQIRLLPPPLRAKLSRGAKRSLRAILLKDPNPTVATSVLGASAVTESEIEMVTCSRQVCSELLATISRSREWTRKYVIVHNLVKNPRTPVGISMRFLPRLSVKDLGYLSKDRNVPDSIRQQAGRMYRAKRA